MNSDKKKISKEDYLELVKDELENLLEEEGGEFYELSINKEQLTEYATAVCSKLDGFKDDQWHLAEIIAATIWEIYTQLPSASLIAFLALKMFRKGINKICEEFTSDR
jgi:hypothetical protein